MDRQQRHQLYLGSVGPGWWPILDKYISRILEADPDVYLYIKEKYGVLRIEMSSEVIPIDQQIAWENAAEVDSSTVCECCGQPGKRRSSRGWMLTLCDGCHNGSRGDRDRAKKDAERRWMNENSS